MMKKDNKFAEEFYSNEEKCLMDMDTLMRDDELNWTRKMLNWLCFLSMAQSLVLIYLVGGMLK